VIRSIRPEDLPRLKALHSKMGFGYPFPELRIHDVGKVVTDESGIPVMAALAVPIVDCYLLLEPDHGTPGNRLRNLLALHESMRVELKERGYRWASADIPPEVEKSFGRRLQRLGWIKSEWSMWATEV